MLTPQEAATMLELQPEALMDALGVKVVDDSSQLGNSLEELFQTLRHTAECLLGLKKGGTLADSMLKLIGGSTAFCVPSM
jgi:hypothetical protein